MSNDKLKAAGHVLHKCDDEHCNICLGDLAYCTICKRGESEFWDDDWHIIACQMKVL